MTGERLMIGTRGSQLALWQSSHVKDRLNALFPQLAVELQLIKTLGDRILDSPLSRIGDKGLFTKELERALLDETVDLAVHSLKDIPTEIPRGLAIAAITVREDVHDVFIRHPKKSYGHLSDVPRGAKIATGSLRRKCQLLRVRPDLEIIDIRGNLNTRFKKLDESAWDGMILAKAGMVRLGWTERITEVLPFETMLPAVGQGALAIEIRERDARTAGFLRHLHDEPTALAVEGERALLRFLEGGCQVPIGTYGRIETGKFILEALIGSPDGKRVVKGKIKGRTSDCEKLGIELARQLLDRGGKEILEEIRSSQKGPAEVEAV